MWFVSDEQVLARSSLDSLNADGCGHDRDPSSECLQDLHTHAAAGANGYNHHGRLPENWLKILHVSSDHDVAAGPCELGHAPGRPTADDEELDGCDRSTDQRENFLGKPMDAVAIRRIEHRGQAQDVSGCRGARLESQ